MSESPDDNVLRVSASSNPQSVASAIAHAIYEKGTCRIRAVGAGPVNQAVKAIAIAFTAWLTGPAPTARILQVPFS